MVLRALFVAALALLPSLTSAATFTVDSKANGGFGVDPATTDYGVMATGPVFSAGETVLITAMGTINPDTSAALFVGPDGVTFDLTGTPLLTPLQEPPPQSRGLTTQEFVHRLLGQPERLRRLAQHPRPVVGLRDLLAVCPYLPCPWDAVLRQKVLNRTFAASTVGHVDSPSLALCGRTLGEHSSERGNERRPKQRADNGRPQP
jgi:hypothetical protein